MLIKKNSKCIPVSNERIIAQYGSMEEAAYEEPELYSYMYGRYNPDSPFYDRENGYEPEYVEEAINDIREFLDELQSAQDKLENKIDMLETDILDLDSVFYEEHRECRDGISRALVEKDYLRIEQERLSEKIDIAEDNLRRVLSMVSNMHKSSVHKNDEESQDFENR